MDVYYGSGFDNFMFDAVPVFIGIIFVFVIGMFIFTAVKGVNQWQKNENSPQLSVPAIVKVKRTNVNRHTHHHNGDMHHTSHSTSTTYYVTFEFESGDRSEFRVSGKEFGLLAEGDFGILTFQGTRYLGFERKK